MPNNRGKEWTFNTVADSYEKIRPGYPDELYQALFAYAAPAIPAVLWKSVSAEARQHCLS